MNPFYTHYGSGEYEGKKIPKEFTGYEKCQLQISMRIFFVDFYFTINQKLCTYVIAEKRQHIKNLPGA